MKTKELELRVDTGFKKYVIRDLDGEKVGEIKFNPSDTGYLRRYDTVIEELNSITLPEDGDEKAMIEVEDRAIKAMEKFLNCPCDDVFAITKPFSPVNDGDFFIEKVLESIVGVVEAETNQRIERKLTKIKKATAKYARGGMKAAVNAAKQ